MYEVLQNLYRIYRSKRFIFMGGGTCNEEVDQVAKRSLKCNVSLSKTEVKAIIKKKMDDAHSLSSIVVSEAASVPIWS